MAPPEGMPSEAVPTPNPARSFPPGLRLPDLLLVLAAAAFWPWSVVAQNLHDIAHPWRLVALVAVVFAVGVVVAAGLVRSGVRSSTATYTVFLALVVFIVGGRFIRALGPVAGWALVLLVLVAFPILLARMNSHVLPRALVVAVAAALIAGPLLASVSAAMAWRISEVTRSDVPRDIVFEQTPDIALFILDGHPGPIAWKQDLPPEGAFIFSELEDRGFKVVASSWSPYWTTALAVPSLLDMAYPLAAPSVNGATSRDLNNILSGDNALVSILDANGYRISVVGSGWSGLRCTEHFDSCWDGPFLDDVLFFTLNDSLIAPWLVGRLGHAFTYGVSRAMEELPQRIEVLEDNQGPDFLLVHLIAPHPPTFLDPECRSDISRERLSVASGPHRVDQEVWNRFFLEQVVCVDGFLLETIDKLPADTAVLVVSDHGTDRRGQSVEGTVWGREETIERLNVVTAARFGSVDCALPSQLVLPNFFRRVLRCLSGSDIGELRARLFSNPLVEIPSPVVVDLLDDSG